MSAAATLTREQNIALEILFRGGALEDARARANIEHETLASWLQDPIFLASLRAARTNLWQETVGKLQAAACKAVETLIDVMQNCNDARVHIRAAQLLVQLSAKAQQEEHRRAERAEQTAAGVKRAENRQEPARTGNDLPAAPASHDGESAEQPDKSGHAQRGTRDAAADVRSSGPEQAQDLENRAASSTPFWRKFGTW